MEISIVIGIYCCTRNPYFDRIFPAIGDSIQLSPTPSGNSSASSKVVMLTFGDTLKSQFTNAKPILDKYGFKGSFFVTCL
jgi:peptidoglycan/xylan/chitin deacetylase (PgdA/CDA1 family)